ncbi:anti-sigma factor [Novosphingobium humi]|uniref:Anti-sigma factor n=1 Tax=Novosphingobium humi TaxID=2282397 RepID=A0ABY7TVN4_9SPHN|nr:hypothetical protein [Novosphingobium humi]WCT76184.1 hypothetical protein PQ457_09490 [Novosphingobium humi]
MMLGDVNELVVRYVDGEMGQEEKRAFEAMLEARPEWQALVAEHTALRAGLIEAWGPAPGEDDLARIHRLLEAPADAAAPLPPARGFQAVRRFWPMAAMAASLVMGVMIGGWDAAPPAAALRVENGRLMAAGALDSALSRQATAQADHGPVTIRMSFRTQDGVCRLFSIAGGTTGLACRQSGRWRVQSTVQQEGEARQQGEYRLAGSSLPPSLMAQVDAMIAGAPLSVKEEQREIAKGWAGPTS